MGFGSYDESEQENQEYDTDFDSDEAVSTEENKHEGELSFENGASSDELLSRLQDIKDN